MYTIEKRIRINSRKFKPFESFEKIDEVIGYVREKALMAESPYVFTHLALSDGTIIRQEYNGWITSPEKLRLALKEAGLMVN